VPTAARRAELVLAAACASGDAVAIAELDRRLGPLVEAIAFRLGAAPALAADALQILRCRLLVASSGRQPGIARFSGQGPLAAWLAIAASRLCWRLLRQARHRGVEDALPSEAADADDPELVHCKNRSAEALAEAFAEAVRRLPDA